MKRISYGIYGLIILLIFSFLIGSMTVVTASDSLPSYTAANTVYLYNFEHDEEIVVKNRTGRIAPASTVKIATGLLLIERLSDRLDEIVTITEEMLTGVEGASLGLEVGDRLTIKDLLYSAICGGNNDAVLALTALVADSEEAFVKQLNARLQVWGCKATHYTNATGVDEVGMYTTLEDVVLLSKRAIDTPLYMEISSAKSYVFLRQNTGETVTIHNRNAIISPYYYQNCQSRYARGLIAGMTDRGGYCVATYAEYEGSSYLCIVMGAGMSQEMPASFHIAFSMLQYCYNNRLYTEVAKAGDTICEIPVSLALSQQEQTEAMLPCLLEDDLFALLPGEMDMSTLEFRTYFHEDQWEAPIVAGQIVGGVDVYDGDRWIGHSRLLAGESLEANPILQTLRKMRSLFFSRASIISLITALILLGIYGLRIYGKQKKRKRKI